MARTDDQDSRNQGEEGRDREEEWILGETECPAVSVARPHYKSVSE